MHSVLSSKKQKMDLSITFLSKYLCERDFGPSMELTLSQELDQALPWKGQELPWNGLSCLSVVCYVLKFSSNSDRSDIFRTISSLDDLASKYYAVLHASDHHASISRIKDLVSEHEEKRPLNWQAADRLEDQALSLLSSEIKYFNLYLYRVTGDPCPENEGDKGALYRQIRERNPANLEKRKEIAEVFVNDFMPKAQEFFSVPNGSEGLAGFIRFLLQILNSESDHIQYEGRGTRILRNIHLFLQKYLHKGLTFLLAVLGDVPFYFSEMKEVKNLLREFLDVANGAGSFVYSYVFRSCPVNVSRFCEHIFVLLENMDSLNVKIKAHCIKFQELSMNQRDSDAPDSVFILDSLLKDTENFMNSLSESIGDIKDQVTILHEELISARSFLKDTSIAEESEIQVLKKLVIEIRDTAYEAEYLMNSLVVGDFPVWYSSLRLPMVIQKFKLIRKRFEEFTAISDIKVQEVKEVHTQDVLSKEIDSNATVGFEDETIEILDELTGGSDNLQIISIVGMPGLGKTTLARKLYNSRLINDHFDKSAWCVVSQAYQKRKVLIDILVSLRSSYTRDKIMKMADDRLILEMYQTLKGRRYLIVMDDVWDHGVWDDLRWYFPNDKNGSRILSTSRIRGATPFSSIFHTLPFLLDDQCWEILEKRVFPDKSCPPQLLSPGKRIAAKCNGLPLAVVAIAGALVNMAKEKGTWEKLEESLDMVTNSCTEILELSYKHLPNYLKLCFLYLGVLFQEDADIPVQKLIQLWIVEGFIRKDDNKSEECVAEEYLSDLINRSLVLVSRTTSTGGVKACNIHDLWREICLRRAKEENFMNLIKDSDESSTQEKYHRLRVLSTAPAHSRSFSLHCRSFFGHLLDPSSGFPQMKHVKVMELSLPRVMSQSYMLKGIDLLVRLRYLVIDRIIPESVLHILVNLEVLHISTHQITLDVVDVSPIITKVAKLRHLHVKEQAEFINDYDGSKPSNLRSLSTIYIRNTKSYKNLASLTHLRKLKCMCLPLLPDLHLLTVLVSLKLGVFHFPEEIPRNNIVINFPLGLKKLSLVETRLPWESMSVVGTLPELQSLKLVRNAFEGEEWETSEDEFKKLRFLKLEVTELKQWVVSSEHFPVLNHLVLVKCNKLQEIPTDLGDIPSLHMIEVRDCSFEASIFALKVAQEQNDNGNKQLRVIVTTQNWSKEQLAAKYEQMEHDGFLTETPLWDDKLTVHTGIACDSCDMFPIVGDRYRCKDCLEMVGYDLCKDCYSSRSKHPILGPFNEQHTSEHQFEIITSNLHSDIVAAESSS